MDYRSTIYDYIPSPSLIFDQEIIEENLKKGLLIAGGSRRLRPHIKTHKSENICRMMVSMGIDKVKCATLSEAETAAKAGIKDILIAYQLDNLQLYRLVKLAQIYRTDVFFSVLIDNDVSLINLLEVCNNSKSEQIGFFFDLNIGQNRCGAEVEKLCNLIPLLKNCPKNLKPRGIHAYDGHIHDSDLSIRRKKAAECKDKVRDCIDLLKQNNFNPSEIIIGGSPTFQIYAETTEWVLSPGTIALWDIGYSQAYPELPFKPAAFLLGRIVSIPRDGQVTADLGTKALSCDGAGDPGTVIYPMDLSHKSQSEEHWVLNSKDIKNICEKIFCIPYHICSTVALYDEVYSLNGEKIDIWKISRKRKMDIEI